MLSMATQFPYQMMSVSFKSDTTGFTRGTVTAYLSGTP